MSRKSQPARRQFTPAGVADILLALEDLNRGNFPEEHSRDSWAWKSISLFLEQLIKNPSIFGDASSLGFIQAMDNITTCPVELGYDARMAASLAAQPMIEDLIDRGGFVIALEGAFLHSFPGCAPRVNYYKDLGFVEVKCPYGPGVLGKIIRFLTRYPSPAVIQKTFTEFFPREGGMLTFKSVCGPDSVRFLVYRTPPDPTVVSDYENDPGVKERIDYMKHLFDLAKEASSP